MTISYAPFDAGNGANVTEDTWRAMFRHFMQSGVIDGERSEFAVSQRAAGANMSVDVAAGTAFIRGHWVDSDATENKAISNGDASNPRIDRVVLRADFTANTITIEVLEGTPASSPSAPALTQSTSRWEISLAQISVAANESTSIETADITDERTIQRFPQYGEGTNATGDLYYRNSSGLIVPLAVGSNDEILKVVSGLPAWAADSATSEHLFARKTADESVTSSTTKQNDDDLTFAIGANEVWTFEIVLLITGATTGDFGYGFSIPSGASGHYGQAAPATTITATEGDGKWLYRSLDQVNNLGVEATGITAIIRGVAVNGATAGSVTLQWAQNTSDATATTVKAGSHLIAHKVA